MADNDSSTPAGEINRYGTVVADPPWNYDYPGGCPPWRSSMRAHYPLMPLADIKALPVSEWAAKDAHLYVWAVLPMMEQAFEVVRAWGFTPSTVVTWCKPGLGLGQAGWRGNTEHLIVGRRGKAPFRASGQGTWYRAPRGSHSAKPEVFMDYIEQLSPGPYLEMFSRRARMGWDTWGNQALAGGEATDVA